MVQVVSPAYTAQKKALVAQYWDNQYVCDDINRSLRRLRTAEKQVKEVVEDLQGALSFGGLHGEINSFEPTNEWLGTTRSVFDMWQDDAVRELDQYIQHVIQVRINISNAIWALEQKLKDTQGTMAWLKWKYDSMVAAESE